MSIVRNGNQNKLKELYMLKKKEGICLKNSNIALIVKNTIMEDLFVDVNNQQCRIDLYFCDIKMVEKIQSNFNKASIEFLDKCSKKLKNEAESGNILFFRKYNYEKILNEYLSYIYNTSIQEINFLEKKPIITGQKPMRNDMEKLSKNEVIQAKKWIIDNWNVDAHTFIKYLSKVTRKKIIIWTQSSSGKLFCTSINDRVIKLKINIHKQKKKYSLVRKNKEHISDNDFNELYNAIKGIELKEEKESLKKMEKYNHIHQDIYDILVPAFDVKRIREYDERYNFLIKRTSQNILKWYKINDSILNGNVYITTDEKNNKLLLHCDIEKNAKLYRFYMNREECFIGGIQQYLEKIIIQKDPVIVINKDLSEYCHLQSMKHKDKKANKMNQTLKKRKINIGMKDIVVRRNIFKCMHEKHFIEDIDIVVKIMNKNVEIEEMIVPAGYCKQCGIFFVLESTYQKMSKKGILIFRSIDEKNYLNHNYLNGKILAKESILMRFGYSVSQAEGLSEYRRHKILSVLVDNSILTKSEIISYLDFFINQRKSEKFALAVSKWEIDREYIRKYKIGEYSKIGVVYKNS